MEQEGRQAHGGYLRETAAQAALAPSFRRAATGGGANLGQANPDSDVAEGKAAPQPVGGQQQEEAQQGAERREAPVQRSPEELPRPAAHLAQQPPWKA